MFGGEIRLWYSPEDRRWLASVPHLPGCMADGATPAEAATAAVEAARLWIEVAEKDGREIPAAPVSFPQKPLAALWSKVQRMLRRPREGKE